MRCDEFSDPPSSASPDCRCRPTFAPSFVMGDVTGALPSHPYTAVSVGRLTGWLRPDGEVQGKVKDALTALEFIEQGQPGADPGATCSPPKP